ncbi:MAG: ABC transporter permease [Chloroflexi bacterium]|nr:ABC transporter permease [Chloroflexota bacterium]
MLGHLTLDNVKREVRQEFAFVARNFNLVKRYWAWELVWLCYSTANALAVSFIGAGVGVISPDSNVNTQFLITYLIIGTLVWGFMSQIFNNIAEMIAWERWEGTIEYTFMAPIRRISQMIGQMIFAVLYAMWFVMVIGTAMVLFFDIDLSNANLGGMLVILLAGSVSFAGIGVVGSILPLLYPERGAQMTHIIQAFLLLVSGVYYPTSVLPDWLQFFSQFSPATYVLEGMRTAVLPGSTRSDNLFSYILPLLVIGVVMLPLGVYLFQRAEVYAKRKGCLKRNG